MKMHTFLETFYLQIGEAYLVNRPEFFADLFLAGGCTHSTTEKQKSYQSDDYRYKLFKGTKPISIQIKRGFQGGTVNTETVASLLETHINRDAGKHCPALMTSFGIDEKLEQDSSCLAMALALQFKAFIDDKENDEVDDIIATEYERLISEDRPDTNSADCECAKDISPKYQQNNYTQTINVTSDNNTINGFVFNQHKGG